MEKGNNKGGKTDITLFVARNEINQLNTKIAKIQTIPGNEDVLNTIKGFPIENEPEKIKITIEVTRSSVANIVNFLKNQNIEHESPEEKEKVYKKIEIFCSEEEKSHSLEMIEEVIQYFVKLGKLKESEFKELNSDESLGEGKVKIQFSIPESFTYIIATNLAKKGLRVLGEETVFQRARQNASMERKASEASEQKKVVPEWKLKLATVDQPNAKDRKVIDQIKEDLKKNLPDEIKNLRNIAPDESIGNIRDKITNLKLIFKSPSLHQWRQMEIIKEASEGAIEIASSYPLFFEEIIELVPRMDRNIIPATVNIPSINIKAFLSLYKIIKNNEFVDLDDNSTKKSEKEESARFFINQVNTGNLNTLQEIVPENKAEEFKEALQFFVKKRGGK